MVINEEGWIVTANHIVQSFIDLEREALETNAMMNNRAAIENDRSINRHERNKRLSQTKKPGNNSTVNVSIWFGLHAQLRVEQWTQVPAVDIAVGKLIGFESDAIESYPIFKDHTKNISSGSSLCKLGFPFHNIVPVWNDDIKGFELPGGALPIPLFPLEGIFTRELVITLAEEAPFIMKLLETSNPGLRGQSGGPTFDTEGAIWGIQTQTAHYELGFSPPVQGGGIEHQFLNVGIAAHVETIVALLSLMGVAYRVSDH